MKTFKKISVITAASAAVIFLLLVLALKTGVLTGSIKKAVEQEAFKASGKNITIGRVELGVYNTVTFRDVLVPVGVKKEDKGTFAEISGVILRLSLIDIVTGKKSPVQALSHVIVDNPKIYIERSGGTVNASYFMESFSNGNTLNASAKPSFPVIPVPVNKLLIENGSVTYTDKDLNMTTEISMIKGSVGLSEKNHSLKIFLSGKSRPSLKRDLSVGLEYFFDSQRFSASAVGKNSDVAYFVGLFAPKDKLDIRTGSFSFDIKADGTEPVPSKMAIKGSLSMRGATATLAGKTELSAMSGDITLDKGRAELSGLDFVLYGGRGRVKGTVEDVFGALSYSMNMKLDSVDLSAVSPDMQGSFGALFDMSGNTLDMKAGGAVYTDKAVLFDVPVSGFRASLRFADKKAELTNVKANVLGGELTGTLAAAVSENGKIDGNLRIKQADLSAIKNKKNFSGKADINLKVYGKTKTPRLEAGINSDLISLSGYEIKNLKAALMYYTGSGYASVNATASYGGYEKLSLKTEAQIAKDSFELKSLKLTDAGEALLDASGKTAPDGTVSYSAQLSNADIKKLRVPALKDKDISGLIGIKAQAGGKKDNVRFSANVESKKLGIKGNDYAFSSAVSFEDETLKVTGFNLGNALRASANISFKKKLFEFYADFKDFSGDIISEIGGVKWIAGSTINGNTVFRRTPGGYGGKAELSGMFGEGLYKSFEFNAFGESGKFDISHLRIKQQKGKLEASGTFGIKNDKDITLEARGRAENYKLGNKTLLDCDFSAAGNASINESSIDTYTRLKAGKLKLNGRREGDLDTSLKTAGTESYDFRLALGDSYSAVVRLTGADNARIIDADIKLKDADLNPVFAIAGLDRKPLPSDASLRAAIKLKGPLDTALLTADITQKQGLIKSYGRLAIKPGRDMLKQLGASLKFDIANISLKDIGMVADAAFDQEGRFSGSGDITADEGRVKVTGDLVAKTGKIAGMDYDDISARYTFEKKRLTFEKMVINYRKTLMDLSGTYIESKRENDYDTYLSADFRNYKIKGNLLNGKLIFFGRLGTGKNMVLNGSLSSDNFMFKNHLFRPFAIKLEYGPDSLTAVTTKGDAPINFKMIFNDTGAEIVEATIMKNNEKMITASGFRKKSGELQLEFNASGVDPQLVDECMMWGHKWKGSADGNVKVSASKGRDPSLIISVNIKNGNVDGLDFDMADLFITIENDYVNLSTLQPILITKTGFYDINVTGKVPVAMSDAAAERLKGVPMDVKISIKEGDLSLLKILGFIESASGPVNATLRMTGTKEFPSLSGKIDVTDGTVKLKYLFRELKHVYANLLISDNIVDIYELKGDTERGTLKIENLNEKKGGVMKFMKLNEFNWKITSLGDSVRFTDTDYMEFLRGDADLDLALTGTLDAPYMQGTMNVHDFTYLYPIKMKTKTGETPPKIKDEDNFAKKIIWDISITGGENVRYYSNYLNNFADIIIAPWSAPLKVQDKANNLKITGNLRIKRGTYKYMNSEFLVDDLKESKIMFDGVTKPVLDAYATTKFRRFKRYESPETPIDLNVRLRVWGRVGDIKIDVSADPPLGLNERDRLLYIMTFGSDINPSSSEFRAEDAAKLADAVASFWIKKGTEQIIGYTPFDVFNIKVDVSKFMQGNEAQKQATPGTGTGTGTTTTAKTETGAQRVEAATRAEIDMGKYLTDSLYVGYNLKLLDASSILPQETIDFQHTVEFEYSLDEINKLKAYKTFVNPMLGTEELFVGWETRWTFESWGQKVKKEEK